METLALVSSFSSPALTAAAGGIESKKRSFAAGSSDGFGNTPHLLGSSDSSFLGTKPLPTSVSLPLSGNASTQSFSVQKAASGAPVVPVIRAAAPAASDPERKKVLNSSVVSNAPSKTSDSVSSALKATAVSKSTASAALPAPVVEESNRRPPSGHISGDEWFSQAVSSAQILPVINHPVVNHTATDPVTQSNGPASHKPSKWVDGSVSRETGKRRIVNSAQSVGAFSYDDSTVERMRNAKKGLFSLEQCIDSILEKFETKADAASAAVASSHAQLGENVAKTNELAFFNADVASSGFAFAGVATPNAKAIRDGNRIKSSTPTREYHLGNSAASGRTFKAPDGKRPGGRSVNAVRSIAIGQGNNIAGPAGRKITLATPLGDRRPAVDPRSVLGSSFPYQPWTAQQRAAVVDSVESVKREAVALKASLREARFGLLNSAAQASRPLPVSAASPSLSSPSSFRNSPPPAPPRSRGALPAASRAFKFPERRPSAARLVVTPGAPPTSPDRSVRTAPAERDARAHFKWPVRPTASPTPAAAAVSASAPTGGKSSRDTAVSLLPPNAAALDTEGVRKSSISGLERKSAPARSDLPAGPTLSALKFDHKEVLKSLTGAVAPRDGVLGSSSLSLSPPFVLSASSPSSPSLALSYTPSPVLSVLTSPLSPSPKLSAGDRSAVVAKAGARNVGKSEYMPDDATPSVLQSALASPRQPAPSPSLSSLSSSLSVSGEGATWLGNVLENFMTALDRWISRISVCFAIFGCFVLFAQTFFSLDLKAVALSVSNRTGFGNRSASEVVVVSQTGSNREKPNRSSFLKGEGASSSTTVSTSSVASGLAGLELKDRIALPGVLELSENNLEAFLLQRPTFVMFYAPWCPYCQRMEESWEKLAEKLQEKSFNVQVARVDAYKYHRLTEKYEIKGFPTLVLFDGLRVLGKHTGRRDVGTLFDFVDRTLP